MDNLFEGGIAELEKIKEAIIDDANRSFELDQARDVLKGKEKEIEAENKIIEERIQEVLKEKRSAVAEPYNKEVEAANSVLKESIRRRDTAKEVAVNQRISNETAAIHEKNVQLDFSTKALLKDSNMPAFCGKPYYLSMFAPKTPKDFIVFVITALIALVGIPLLVITLVQTTTLGKIFIYIGIVLFFCLVYLAIFFWTQPNKKRKTLELARPDVEQIKKNKKEMKKMTRSIRSDKDESGYGLEELDNEIVRNRGLYDEAVARRDEALKQFEEQIIPDVRSEVSGARAEVMDTLTAERDFLKQDVDEKTKAAKIAEQELHRDYGSYIGKKNMDPDKIDQLIDIIKEGKATNILGALDVQKNEGRLSNRIAGAAERRKNAEDEEQDSFVNTDSETAGNTDAKEAGYVVTDESGFAAADESVYVDTEAEAVEAVLPQADDGDDI